jgi:chromosome segregation ATPase
MDNKDIRLLKQMKDSTVSLPELTEKSEYSRQQVHYRLNEKWTELVEKSGKVENSGDIYSTTLWRLSTQGEEKLESVEISDEDDDKIETFEELSEAAEEARRDSESAKSSVQQYRKKVSRIERRLSSIKEATGQAWSDIGEDVDLLTREDKEELKADYTSLEGDLKSLENSLKSVRTDVEELETEQIEYLLDSVDDLENKLSQISSKNNELKSENRKLQTDIDTQSKRISELEDELERRKNRTLIERISDMF